MAHLSRPTFLALFLAALLPLTARADLRGYVDKPDASYAVKFLDNHDIGANKIISLQLTSQTWRGITWTHWLSIIVPAKIEHPDKAVLHIMGGSNKSKSPDLNSTSAKALIGLANQTGSIMVILQQVPNQPLFGDKHEDALIALTFAKFIETQDEEWPLLLPMVKSAVRAMDATQAIAKERLKLEIKEFIVTGASKRGWTTWLTAAVDKRVIAIAPMVIDVLNFSPQMKHQEQSYGRLSEEVADYDKLDLPRQLQNEKGKNLARLVDPYSYIDKLTIPKLMLLGTNDPYWTVDASSHYFPQLKGNKQLYYEPNTGHGLGAGIYPTVIAFFDASLRGKTLPELTWKKTGPGAITVEWSAKGAIPTLWQATADSRDFRKAKWTSKPIEGEGKVEVKLDAPAKGWSAFYVGVRFPNDRGLPFVLSTEMSVVPETFPHQARTFAPQ